jgi:hypothetical protein
MPHIVKKLAIRANNFALDLTLIGGLKKVMAFQSVESSNIKNFRTPNLGVSRQNDI